MKSFNFVNFLLFKYNKTFFYSEKLKKFLKIFSLKIILKRLKKY